LPFDNLKHTKCFLFASTGTSFSNSQTCAIANLNLFILRHHRLAPYYTALGYHDYRWSDYHDDNHTLLHENINMAIYLT
jgi:hypothetical protein